MVFVTINVDPSTGLQSCTVRAWFSNGVDYIQSRPQTLLNGSIATEIEEEGMPFYDLTIVSFDFVGASVPGPTIL